MDAGIWTAERIAELHRLWAEGHSTAQIARMLGCGKNAVMSKAHRLRLPSRPNPVGVRSADPKPELRPVQTSHHRGCQWIHGQPAGAETRFCGAPVARPGCSWCAAHLARVFTARAA